MSRKVKIWVDDVRPIPVGYEGTKSVNETIALIEQIEAEGGEVELLDLDHDLGDYAKDGGDAINILDYLVERETFYPIAIHTANPVGRANMERVVNRFWPWKCKTEDAQLDLIYDKIHTLRNFGFKIAIDDFGSGYSSLNMLKEMPLDIIKMDLKFLDNDQQRGRLILKSLIEMAQNMDLHVVVEGVELLTQVEFLSQFKDCILQGFYFSRPILTNELETMLDEN